MATTPKTRPDVENATAIYKSIEVIINLRDQVDVFQEINQETRKNNSKMSITWGIAIVTLFILPIIALILIINYSRKRRQYHVSGPVDQCLIF